MPANSKEYQKAYRQKTKGKRHYVTVALSPEEHQLLTLYAKTHQCSASTLLRKATLLLCEQSQLASPEIEQELRELRFLMANIANNLNQIARHSNRVKQVVDDEAALRLFREMETTLKDFVDSRLNPSP